MFSEIFSQYKHVLVALLGNKKPTFLTYNPKQVYAAILDFSKKKHDVFQNRQTYSRQILEISQNVMRKNEVKASKDGRHLLAITCYQF